MSRKRSTAARARATGADVLHPGRHAGRNTGKAPPLGDAPEWMDERQRWAWEALRGELPWLGLSDTALVEIAAVLRARLVSGGEVGVNALAQLRMCLSSMGGTPVDAARIAMPADDEDDDVSGYFA